MNASSRVRRRVGIAGIVAALTILGALPTAASADVVGDLVKGLGLDGNAGSSGGGGQGTGQSEASTSNPHAQGTVARVDVTPPESLDLGGLLDDEEAVVGRTRAEQTGDGNYKGHVTILALFGEEIIGIDTDAGETAGSPLQPLNDVLNEVCGGTSGVLCVAVLPASSATDGTGSANDFGVVRASSRLGENTILDAGVAESDASLRENGSCQSAHAGSSVARAGLLNNAIVVGILQSVADSVACSDGGGSSSSDSTILAINDQTLPLPGDCDGGTNGGFGILSLVTVSCNVASGALGEGSASAGAEPIGTAIVGDDPPLVGANASNSATGAGASQTPEAPDGPDGPGGGGSGGDTTGSDDGGGAGTESGDGAGGAADDAQAGSGSLAFTGLNAALLAVIGLALLGMGVALSSRLARPTLSR